MTQSGSENEIDKPPLVKKWHHLYLIVIGWLFLQILLFYFFSTAY